MVGQCKESLEHNPSITVQGIEGGGRRGEREGDDGSEVFQGSRLSATDEGEDVAGPECRGEGGIKRETLLHIT